MSAGKGHEDLLDVQELCRLRLELAAADADFENLTEELVVLSERANEAKRKAHLLADEAEVVASRIMGRRV